MWWLLKDNCRHTDISQCRTQAPSLHLPWIVSIYRRNVVLSPDPTYKLNWKKGVLTFEGVLHCVLSAKKVWIDCCRTPRRSKNRLVSRQSKSFYPHPSVETEAHHVLTQFFSATSNCLGFCAWYTEVHLLSCLSNCFVYTPITKATLQARDKFLCGSHRKNYAGHYKTWTLDWTVDWTLDWNLDSPVCSLVWIGATCACSRLLAEFFVHVSP